MSTTPTTSAQPVRTPVKTVGLMIGLAAATPGLPSPIPGLPVRPWHVFLLIAFAAALVHHMRVSRNSIFRLTRIDLLVSAFTLVTFFIELINAGQLNYAPDVMSVVRPLFWLLAYSSVRYTAHTLDDAASLLKFYTFAAFPSVALGFGQVLGIEAIQQLVAQLSPDASGFISRIEDGRLVRATGLVQHWTSFGSYLCTVMAAASALLILARRHHAGREWFAWCAIAVAGFGVLTTLTLASIITAALIFLACLRPAHAMARAAPLMLLVAIISAATLGSLFTERYEQQFETSRVATSDGDGSLLPSTLTYRYNIWISETIPMIQERPLTGWGTNVYEAVLSGQTPQRIYPYKLYWASPESQWFALLMNYGYLGLVGFVAILLMLLRLMSRTRGEERRWVSRPTTVLFLLMVVAAFTAPVFTNYGLPLGLWMLSGLMAASLKFAGSTSRTDAV